MSIILDAEQSRSWKSSAVRKECKTYGYLQRLVNLVAKPSYIDIHLSVFHVVFAMNTLRNM